MSAHTRVSLLVGNTNTFSPRLKNAKSNDAEMLLTMDTILLKLLIHFVNKPANPAYVNKHIKHTCSQWCSAFKVYADTYRIIGREQTHTYHYDLSALLFPSNNIHTHIGESILIDDKQYHALALLYKSKGNRILLQLGNRPIPQSLIRQRFIPSLFFFTVI